MNKYLLVIRIQLVLIAALLGVLIGPHFFTEEKNAPTASLSVDTHLSSLPPPPTHPPVTMPNIEGKAAFVWDIKEHRIIFAKHEHDKLPLASVTKMMMALTASELLPSDTKITIHPEDLREEGDSGLAVGETWTFKKLLDLTLVSSSNDGASKIASVAGAKLLTGDAANDPEAAKKIFIDRMNRRAHALGLDDTHFQNATGLDLDSVTSGAYGSARDMGMLFEYIWRKHPELFADTSQPFTKVTSESNVVHKVKNTNDAVGSYNGIIGSKTGFTELAGGNLVVIQDVGLNHPVVIAVLGSTREGRFDDVTQLSKATVQAVAEHPVTPYGG